MNKRMRSRLLLLFLTALCAPAFLYAEAGTLDTTFDGDGKVVTNLGGFEIARSVAIQPDEKIVIAGSSLNDMLIIRYDENGSLDATFSGDGVETVDFALGDDEAYAVEVDSNGKIVAGGYATDPVTGEDFALARFNSDGTPDLTFNLTGKVTIDFNTPLDRIFDIKIDSSGKIVAAGRACSAGSLNNCNFIVARYNPDGSPDEDFGIDGFFETDFMGDYDEPSALWIHSNGTILLVGGSGVNVGMARYNPDGSPDFAFSGDGKLVTDLGLEIGARAWDVLVYPDGRILVAGQAGSTPEDFVVARFHSDGSLDSNFGASGTGVVRDDFFSGIDAAQSVTLQYDYKIIVSGWAELPGADRTFGLIRYTQNGLLDDSFGDGGKVTTDFMPGAGFSEIAYAVALQHDGKIVAAGRADIDVALARYQGDDLFLALFVDGFEDGILDPEWRYTKPAWLESGGSLLGVPQNKKAEAIAIPAFDGCQQCAVSTRMNSRGGPGNKVWLLAWYENKANMVELLMKEESDRWVLKHRANGKIVSKQKVSSVIEPHVTYTVNLAFDGTQFTLTVDSVVILTMPAAIAPNGSVGFRVKNTTGTFEGLAVPFDK